MSPRNMISKEFEFYYLTELTRKKVKPLSRWEKHLNRNKRRWLKQQGLHLEKVERRLLNGDRIYETVFSTSTRYIDYYLKKFAHTVPAANPTDVQREGFLFGYPSCCVRQFMENPYIPNELSREDQSILFHWACNYCRATRELLPYYRSVYQSTKEWYQQHYSSSVLRPARQRQNILMITLAALLSSTIGINGQTAVDSTHVIPLAGDPNQNNLTYAEEIYLGLFDRGQLSDTQREAKRLAALIDSLPTVSGTDHTFKIEHWMSGDTPCPKCGQMVNMGHLIINNPRRQLQMDLPFMALHFIEHGSFSFVYDSSNQRIDIDTLKRILDPFDPRHMLNVIGDRDGDGLTDGEEDSLRMEDTRNNLDFDNDGVPDGAQLAEGLIRLFPKLSTEAELDHSRVTFNLVRGRDTCKVCGSTHNMGTVTIENPENGRQIEIPQITLHAMAHGSFAYDGTGHPEGRADAIKLVRTMKTHQVFIDDDDDRDGLTNDGEELFGYDNQKADTDGDGISDGRELAVIYAQKIRSLPTEPRTDEPYVIDLGMDGIHICPVCGQEIVMGLLQIYNPLINTAEPLNIGHYAFHFLEHGSFACEGVYNSRIDPQQLIHYLGNPTSLKNPSVPAAFQLHQNQPNPFNPSTTIGFTLNRSGRVTLDIYDITGKKIETLLNNNKTEGRYQITFDGSHLSSGLYLYRLTTDQGYSKVRKMILMK